MIDVYGVYIFTNLTHIFAPMVQWLRPEQFWGKPSKLVIRVRKQALFQKKVLYSQKLGKLGEFS